MREDSSITTVEQRQIEANAVADYVEEENALELDRISSEINDELSDIAHAMSDYTEFADKLGEVNGELSAIDHEYNLGGVFDTDITVENLEAIKNRVDRVVNDTHGGNQFNGVARAMQRAVSSVTLGYEEVIL